MLIVFIIAIIIGIVALISYVSSDGSNSNKLSDADLSAAKEVLRYVESVEKIYSSNSSILCETLGLFMIIPFAENDDIYNPQSCRVILSLTIFEKGEYNIQTVNRLSEETNSNFTSYFKQEMMTDNLSYVVRTNCKFTSKYKTFMSYLYDEIEKRYSGKFSFDGSRIMSKANIDENIFY